MESSQDGRQLLPNHVKRVHDSVVRDTRRADKRPASRTPVEGTQAPGLLSFMLYVQSTAGNRAAQHLLSGEAVLQRAPKQKSVVIPSSPSRQAMIKQLLDEHPGLHPKVADDAVHAAQRVMGAGGAGGDVVLDPRVTREVSVHSGRLDQKTLTSHLQEEVAQAGVREIYLQINTPGATSESVRQVMKGIQNGVPELAGVRVRIYDSQGRMIWSGNMRFRDTDPAASRTGGGQSGPGGGTGPAPAGSGLAGTDSSRGRGPAAATDMGLLGGVVRPTSTPAAGGATSSVDRAAMARAIAASGTGVARSVALTGRIKVYVKGFAVLLHLLTLLSAIDSMQKLLAHGTAMPKEQRAADKVLSDSILANEAAGQVTENVDLVGWVTLSGEAERANDADSLFAIDVAASAFRDSLERSAEVAKSLGEDLELSAKSIKGEMYKRFVGILMPNTGGTGQNAVDFALYRSLELLHGTTLAASRNYAEAAESLDSWAVQFRAIDRWANAAAWAIARGKAWDQYEAAHPTASKPAP